VWIINLSRGILIQFGSMYIVVDQHVSQYASCFRPLPRFCPCLCELRRRLIITSLNCQDSELSSSCRVPCRVNVALCFCLDGCIGPTISSDTSGCAYRCIAADLSVFRHLFATSCVVLASVVTGTLAVSCDL